MRSAAKTALPVGSLDEPLTVDAAALDAVISFGVFTTCFDDDPFQRSFPPLLSSELSGRDFSFVDGTATLHHRHPVVQSSLTRFGLVLDP